MINRNTILNSYQKWNIGAVVRDILLSNDELVQLVNNHIYPCIAPENTNGNFIVYKREKYSKSTVHQGVYEDECKLSLTVISDNYDESTQIASLIDNILTGQHLIENNTVRLKISLADSTEGWEDNKYYQVLLYEIK